MEMSRWGGHLAGVRSTADSEGETGKGMPIRPCFSVAPPSRLGNLRFFWFFSTKEKNITNNNKQAIPYAKQLSLILQKITI